MYNGDTHMEMVSESTDAWLSDDQINAILATYHRQQLTETLIGPSVSFAMHLVMLILAFTLIMLPTPETKDSFVVVREEIKIEEIPDIPPEVIDEKEDIEKEIEMELNPDTPKPPEPVLNEASPNDVSDEVPETADNQQEQDVLDVCINNSPRYVTLSGGMTNRGRPGTGVNRFGSPKSKRIQDKTLTPALNWLARVQNPNGSWGDGKGWSEQSGHPAHTGLAVLVFLAHGDTPQSDAYGDTVLNGLRWLASYGNQSDLAKIARRRPGAYTHGIATYAISEAYAMTKNPFMKTAMENAVAVLIDGQMANGGFGYGYTDGPRWDLSVAGWNIQALKAARMAGCQHEKLSSALEKSVSFLRHVAYAGNGGFGYAGKASSARGNMGGVGTLCLQLLGYGEATQTKDGCTRIGGKRLADYQAVAEDVSKWNKVGGDSLYGWYYDTQVVFNSQNTPEGKRRWKAWRNAFETALEKSQHSEGYWETGGQHKIGTADTPGRILATCLCALQLEVYYRNLPTFDKSRVEANPVVGAGTDIIMDGDSIVID